jgi:hypothetical protein
MYQLFVYGKDSASPSPMFYGNTVEGSPTVEKITKLHDLNSWMAEKIPNFNEQTVQVKDSYHIRRTNELPETQYHGIILHPYVNTSYKVMQYSDAVKWLDPFLQEQMLTVDSSLMLDKGAKFSVLCDINVEAKIAEGDTVNRYLLLALSHDKSMRGLFYCDTRPICANTLAMAKMEGLRSPEKNLVLDDANPEKSLKLARKLIDLTTQKFHDSTVLEYKSFAKLELQPQQVDYIFRTILNMPLGTIEVGDVSDSIWTSYTELGEAYKASPGMELINGDTGWRVFNAVTYFNQNLGKTESQSYQKNLFGAGSRYRKQTTELLTQLLPSSAIPV